VSFVAEFKSLPLEPLVKRSQTAGVQAVRESMAKAKLSLADFAHLISPAAAELLEHMGRRSHAMTQQRFGKVIRMFAPLYLSNECVNNCQYCGFSRDNPILRVTLSLEEVKREAQALKEQGFRNLLLVAGNIRSSFPMITSRIASPRCMRIGLAFRLKSGRWKRRITGRSSRRARTGW